LLRWRRFVPLVFLVLFFCSLFGPFDSVFRSLSFGSICSFFCSPVSCPSSFFPNPQNSHLFCVGSVYPLVFFRQPGRLGFAPNLSSVPTCFRSIHNPSFRWRVPPRYPPDPFCLSTPRFVLVPTNVLSWRFFFPKFSGFFFIFSAFAFRSVS